MTSFIAVATIIHVTNEQHENINKEIPIKGMLSFFVILQRTTGLHITREKSFGRWNTNTISETALQNCFIESNRTITLIISEASILKVVECYSFKYILHDHLKAHNSQPLSLNK